MHRIRQYSGKNGPARLFLLLILGAGLLACRAPTEAPVEKDEASLAASPAAARRCVEGGGLRTELYGAIDGAVDWFATPVVCEGMPRPGGEGARLRFAGPSPSGDGTLVFIAAIPSLSEDLAADELPTSLTIIEEGRSRFFAVPGSDSCWTDIFAVDVIDGQRHAISGRITCITALGEVNGSATVSVSDLHFRGVIDWGAS